MNDKSINNVFIRIISILLKMVLFIAIIFILIHMILGMYDIILKTTFSITGIESSLYSFVDIIVEDSLLAIVVFEIYESVLDFFAGKGKTITYILSAAISFTAREIILLIFTVHVFSRINFYEIISLSILVVSLSIAYYMIYKSESIDFKK